MRISGRKSANPPGCEGACTSRAISPGNIKADNTIVGLSVLPGTPARAPWLVPDPANHDPRPLSHLTPYLLCEACLKVRTEFLELPKTDSLANFTHDVKVKVEVVVGVQDRREKLPSGIKMPQVCTGIPLTNRAAAIFI